MEYTHIKTFNEVDVILHCAASGTAGYIHQADGNNKLLFVTDDLVITDEFVVDKLKEMENSNA